MSGQDALALLCGCWSQRAHACFKVRMPAGAAPLLSWCSSLAWGPSQVVGHCLAARHHKYYAPDQLPDTDACSVPAV